LFSGRLDWSTCSEIERELLSRVTEFRNRHENVRLVFDLTEVIFVSSIFLRLCLIYYKTLGAPYFAVVNVSEEIYEVFHVSGFVELMNVTQG
jgi:anti-anti-sigma factor